MKRTMNFWTYLLAVFAASASPVFADSLVQGDLLFELNQIYYGTGIPTGTPPWLTATFQNQDPNSVLLTMVYSGGTAGSPEYVSDWDFNFDSDLEVLGLGFSLQSGVEAIPSKAPDGITAGNNLKFDIGFSFSPGTFTAGSTSVYLISSTQLIDALSFDFLSTNTNSPASTNYYSAASILEVWIAAETSQTPSPGPGPGPAPVPEPATMILLTFGLGGLTVFGRKKFSR